MGLWDSISNGLAAAANHGAEIFQKRALLEAQNEAEIAREQRMEEYRRQREIDAEERKETARKAEVSAINTRADEMGGVPEARGLVDAGITDRSAWTPEHQAAVDQSMRIRRDENRTAAAIDLGAISPKEVFSSEREDKRHEATMSRQELIEEKRDARLEKQEESRNERLDKQLAKPTGGRGTDRDPDRIETRLKIAREDRLAFEKEASELRKAMEGELKDANLKSDREAIRKKYEPQLTELAKQRKDAQEEYDTLRKMLDNKPEPTIRVYEPSKAEGGRGFVNPPEVGASAPSPAPAPAASAPMSSSSRPQSPRPEGDDTDTARIIRSEYQKAQQMLAAETDPDKRRRLQGDLVALESEARRGKFSLTPGAAPAARPPISAFNR